MCMYCDPAIVSSIENGSNPFAGPGAMGLPTFSVQEVADQLTTGFWGGGPYAWDIPPGGTIDVDISRLTPEGQELARLALDAWTMTTGIQFNITELDVVAFGYPASGIIFDDNDSGAYANFLETSDNSIYSAKINVGTDWLNAYGTDIDTYSFQTYIHEIGHALGLGHAGNYNGSANYNRDALYANDSWQMSIMSYFSQSQNPNVDASFAYVMTPMLADIQAISDLYGLSGTIRTGDTTYGEGSNAGGYYDELSDLGEPITYTIVDDGGTDTLVYNSTSAAQRIDLTPGSISDVDGLRGNISINTGTIIENVVTGNGADTIIGNSADNVITAGGNRDTVNGNGGNDDLSGEGGFDRLSGGLGEDTLTGGADFDILTGGAGGDIFAFKGDGSDGTDLIRDFEDGVDQIAFEELAGMQDLTISNVGFGARVSWDGGQVFLLGTTAAELTSEDFLFG